MYSKKFISATKEFNTYEKHVPAPYIRKAFTLKNEIASAEITICGLGFYRLFINGQDITKGYLAPYISNPDDILYYDSYDITDLLKENNALGIILGNGQLNAPGGTVWDLQLPVYRSAPKVALALEIKYKDGTAEVIEADESFKTHPSPITFDDMRSGERYDARLEIDGWYNADFDDSDWNNAIIAETPRGDASMADAENIITAEKLSPISVKKGGITYHALSHEFHPKTELSESDSVGYIYDFGKNTAGTVTLKIKGEAGQRVAIQFCEVLAEDGGLDLRNMPFQTPEYDHRIIYTLKGGETEIYSPSFCYFGFRYCLVSGITEEQATNDLLTFNVMHSDIKKNGDFKCSDDIINRLQKATVNSDLSNFYYYPTDCPHREKLGWTGDAANSAEQLLFNFYPERSYREWMKNIRKAQRDDGAIPGIIPTGGWGFDWNGPLFDRVCIYIPYYVWLYRGETVLIKENAHMIIRYLQFVSSTRLKTGLVAFGLPDWVHVGRNRTDCPLEVTSTLACMDMCKKASKLFEVIGATAEKAYCDVLYKELREAARKHLIEPDGYTVIGRCQGAQAFGIYYELFDAAEKPEALEVLLGYIKKHGDHFDCGVFTLRILFHLLCENGYGELAYKMMFRPEFPSYGCWIVEENADALFESFVPHGDISYYGGSHNHHFHGDISSWFFKYLLGVKINPNAEDIKEIEISPIFVGGLTNAEGYINMPYGKISAEWHENPDGSIDYTLDVPEGVYGFLRLPEGYTVLHENKLPYRYDEVKSYTYKIQREK